MTIYLCIDDTDSIDSRGTGELAELIRDGIEQAGWGKTDGVTRHQLLLDKDIAYTSHNSSMCFRAEIADVHFDDVVRYASAFLEKESEPGSDPGLCVVRCDALLDTEALIRFGYKTKRQVVRVEEAYALAARLRIHLSAHGGTGEGVIGALAGAGLRISGSDGWFKGALPLRADTVMTVAELCALHGVEGVKLLDGPYLDGSDTVQFGKMNKAMLVDGKAVLLVTSASDGYKSCSKKQLMEHEESKLHVAFE